MCEEKIKIISEALNKLIVEIEEFIRNGISTKIIQPENESYFRWLLKDFAYGEKGIICSGATGEYVTKKSWSRVFSKISDSIKESSGYKNTLQELSAAFTKNKNIEKGLDAFVRKVIHEQLDSGVIQKANGESLIERFIRDLLEKPIKYGAEIELQGIVLRAQRIRPVHGIIIRQPLKDDLEKETLFYGPMRTHGLSYPSAIANIEFLGRLAQDIQIKVGQMIVILRLFKVGSIKYLSYKMHSDSIIDIMPSGTLTSGERDQVLETSIINEDDEEKIKFFWEKIERVLPSSLYDFGEKEISPISLAYDRYSVALMHNGLLERRIANVVMGLEALLLDAAQELSYRLGLRVAKIMSLLGDNPQEVRRIVKDAYNIRNLFAHGSHLSYQQKKKLELRYKDIKDIFSSVINYLRQLIVIMILIQKSKDEFIDLVDDSLIDRKEEESLNNLLSEPKRILG